MLYITDGPDSDFDNDCLLLPTKLWESNVSTRVRDLLLNHPPPLPTWSSQPQPVAQSPFVDMETQVPC